MAEMVALAFDNPQEADRVLTDLVRMQKEYLVDLADAVVVIRQPDGNVHLKQSVNLVGVGAASGGLSGALWGSLVGLLFLNPLAGFAMGGLIGAGTGALSGTLIDYGIDDNFIRSLADTLQPNTSALFVLVRKAQPEKVLAELQGVRGRILRTSLSPEQEGRLKAALPETLDPNLGKVGLTRPPPPVEMSRTGEQFSLVLRRITGNQRTPHGSPDRNEPGMA